MGGQDHAHRSNGRDEAREHRNNNAIVRGLNAAKTAALLWESYEKTAGGNTFGNRAAELSSAQEKVPTQTNDGSGLRK